MYHASISREESEFISFHMVFFNPDTPAVLSPVTSVRDPWQFIPLEHPEEMTLPNISKLALCSHPRSSALAVYPNADGTLFIWGLIDQLNRYEDFIRLENSTAPHRPGLFEARIVGPGHILVSIEYKQIAELKIDGLSLDSVDIFERGPLFQKLAQGVAALQDHLLLRLSPDEDVCIIRERVRTLTVATIQRLLFRIKGFKHGGAILIVADVGNEGLNTKYGLHYTRLHEALKRYVVSLFDRDGAVRQIECSHADDRPLMRKKLARLQAECRENEKEIEAAIWFIALLTRIDGLVLMNQSLEVIGFGVEITTAQVPHSVKKIFASDGAGETRKKFNYTYYGTRHRSMMRHCHAYPGSVGFVISQDGDVRAIARVDDDVCLWENFRLLPEITPHDTFENGLGHD
ncbi:MAG TPA: hypothetical protein HPP94_04000 [Desulfuromonadales bacterium]|nr:hypothetical protein [Desulfuromonadales bacterium]